jgi:hypothetical protein
LLPPAPPPADWLPVSTDESSVEPNPISVIMLALVRVRRSSNHRHGVKCTEPARDGATAQVTVRNSPLLLRAPPLGSLNFERDELLARAPTRRRQTADLLDEFTFFGGDPDKLVLTCMFQMKGLLAGPTLNESSDQLLKVCPVHPR